MIFEAVVQLFYSVMKFILGLEEVLAIGLKLLTNLGALLLGCSFDLLSQVLTLRTKVGVATALLWRMISG